MNNALIRSPLIMSFNEGLKKMLRTVWASRTSLLLGVLLGAGIHAGAVSEPMRETQSLVGGNETMLGDIRELPQMATSYRLLKLGERIEFTFQVPEDVACSALTVYPRYLEGAKPGSAFSAGGDLKWVETLQNEEIPLSPKSGRAVVKYQPKVTGSYLAKWTAGGETFYRYFSVIDDDYVVLSFSPFCPLEPEPTLHATGIPLDYRLPSEQFKVGDPLFDRFARYNRLNGDNLIPILPDTPELDQKSRQELYGPMLSNVRALLPDSNEGRSAWVEVRNVQDPGYGETLAALGINDHCGLWCANATPWIGMPEFPYLSSPIDCRQMNQTENGSVVSHQWDFCGGWHFLGPVSWHFKVSEGEWPLAEKTMLTGIAEFENLARMSGHPAFVNPLYEAVEVGVGHPNPDFPIGPADGERMKEFRAFIERYQRFIAFELPQGHKVAFARSLDVADYYRRHFKTTPKTLFVSKTDNVMYDIWWTYQWEVNHYYLVTRERLPWLTNVSKVPRIGFKDPLSYEFILVEDSRWSIRFERESPNPIWRFDYQTQAKQEGGSVVAHTETPDVYIPRAKWIRAGDTLSLDLKMQTAGTFTDYAIAVWGLPSEFDPVAPIVSNAKECIVVNNTDGEHHLVLFFDLEPDLHIQVKAQVKR